MKLTMYKDWVENEDKFEIEISQNCGVREIEIENYQVT